MEAAEDNNPSGSVGWLERKHNKMLWAAFWANVLFWSILVLYVVLFISSCVQSFWILHYPWHIDSLSDVVYSPPQTDTYLRFGLNIFGAFVNLFTGIAYALASKGVSLGLKMLVETDLNYKLSREEETHA
jgi:hypothetical protein